MKMDGVRRLPRVPAGARYHPEWDQMIQVTLGVSQCPPQPQQSLLAPLCSVFPQGKSFPAALLARLGCTEAERNPCQSRRNALFSQAKEISALRLKILLKIPVPRCRAKRLHFPSSSHWALPLLPGNRWVSNLLKTPKCFFTK